MSDNQFGGSGMGGPAKTGNAGFDFFGGATAPAAGPSAFGSGPAPAANVAPALSAFGAPPAQAISGPPAGAFPAPPSGSSTGSGRSIAGVIVLAIGILLGLTRAYAYYAHHRSIAVPTTLGGMPTATEPKLAAVGQQAKTSIQAENTAFNLDAAVYGDAKKFVILLVGRGDSNIAKEIPNGRGTVHSGDSTCNTQPDQTVACMRTGGQLTVVVAGAGEGTTVESIAAMVDEAWRQQ